MAETKQVHISLRLTKEELALLEAAAEVYGESRCVTIRRCLWATIRSAPELRHLREAK